MGVVHVHVAHAQDNVVTRLLGVNHQLVVLGVMEFQVVVFLQGGMFLTGGVYPTDKVLDTRTAPVVNLVLVLLTVGQFFLDRTRDIFAQLVAVVHTGKARKSSRQKVTLLEGVGALVGQVLRENVRSRREEYSAHVFLRTTLGKFLQVLLEFPFGRPPGKVGIAHVKAGLCQTVHHFRASEGLGQEHQFRAFFLHVGNKPFPEGERLSMGVVDTENLDSLVGPEQNDVLDFFPQGLVVFVVVVEGVNVFVLLGRVFRKLDAAVRFVKEPFRVTLHVGMVRAAVEGNVQR